MRKEYEKCINLLNYNVDEKPSWEKACSENNLGLVFCMNKKFSLAQKLLLSSANGLYKLYNQTKKLGLFALCEKAKENLVLAHLLSRDGKETDTHSSL